MREYVKLSVVLLLICAIACGALGFVNEITKDVIAENNAKVAAQARMEVMPAADDITEMVEAAEVEKIASTIGITTAELAEIYVAKAGGEVVGYTFTTNSKGFGGTLNVITGVGVDGKITGAKVVSHSETPGLGAKSTDPNWIGQYAGLTADGTVAVVKSGAVSGNQILAITGSTITSNGVTTGVNYAGQAYLAMVGGN
ncbi:MAG: RnfABCDGE type electron transport complex subunit G [Anaerofustis stercorihominis]|nr:RnfABCDGE type electron transport complex subunit G [Anaerofustis stercorihominis]